MRNNNRVPGTAAVTACVLLLAAYGSTPDAPADDHPQAVAPLIQGDTSGRQEEHASGGPNPVVRELTAREKTMLYEAEQLLLRDCMRAHGFEYRPVPQLPVPDAREFPYVIDDQPWARRHGYGSDIAHALAKARESDVNQKYFRSLPPSRRAQALKAANGANPTEVTARTPDGMVLQRSSQGCQSEAERILYGDLPTWFQAKVTLDSLEQIRSQRVLADPQFTQAVKPWADCMRAAGHPYNSPTELREKALRDQKLPREREIALAVTEARCATDSGLAAKAKALDQEQAERLNRQYRTELDTAHRLQLAALPRARSVTAHPR